MKERMIVGNIQICTDLVDWANVFVMLREVTRSIDNDFVDDGDGDYETMCFEVDSLGARVDSESLYCERCDNENEALSQHSRIVQMVKGGEISKPT